jgi:hypothetical protein
MEQDAVVRYHSRGGRQPAGLEMCVSDTVGDAVTASAGSETARQITSQGPSPRPGPKGGDKRYGRSKAVVAVAVAAAIAPLQSAIRIVATGRACRERHGPLGRPDVPWEAEPGPLLSQGIAGVGAWPPHNRSASRRPAGLPPLQRSSSVVSLWRHPPGGRVYLCVSRRGVIALPRVHAARGVVDAPVTARRVCRARLTRRASCAW